MDLPERLLWVFVNRMTLRGVFGGLLNSFDYAGNYSSSVILRIPRDESPNRAEFLARFGRPDDFHATPNSRRIASWE